MNTVPGTAEEMHEYLIKHGIATEEEISLVTSIKGTSTKTYEDILFSHEGCRIFDQLEEFDDVDDEGKLDYRDLWGLSTLRPKRQLNITHR